jgi:hypothetical protein
MKKEGRKEDKKTRKEKGKGQRIEGEDVVAHVGFVVCVEVFTRPCG